MHLCGVLIWLVPHDLGLASHELTYESLDFIKLINKRYNEQHPLLLPMVPLKMY